MNGILSIEQWLYQKKTDDKSILLEHDGVCSYREFMMDVTGLTAQLRSSPYICIALICKDTGLFIRILLALILSGKTIYLPSNSQLGTLKELKLLTDALLTDEVIENFGGIQIHVDKKYFAKIFSNFELYPNAIQQSSLIFYTSGSSGKPKPVIKKIEQIEKEIHALESLWGSVLDNAIILSTVTHQHIYGVLFRILWPLLSGRLIDTNQYEYPEQLIAQISLHQSVAIITSPAHLDRLSTDLEWPSDKNLNVTLFSSGAPLSTYSAKSTYRCFGNFPIDMLGSTETGAVAWRQQLSILANINTTLNTHKVSPFTSYVNLKYTKNIKTNMTGWQPLPGVTIDIKDQCLNVFSPWLDNPKLGFLMADRACIVENEFFLLGRVDRIVKIEGKRVSLSEMERRLCGNHLVSEAWLVELKGQRKQIGVISSLSISGRALLKEHGRLSVSQKLKQDLSNFFEAVTLPRKWRFLKIMPVNQLGKRVNSELVQLFAEKQKTDDCDA